MTELKPCPFCGQTPKMEESARFPRYGKDKGKRIIGYTVVCQNMYCILHNEDNWYRRSGKEACEAWNHRAEPENRVLTLEKLAEMAYKDDWEFVWLEYQSVPNFLTHGCPSNANESRVCFLTPGMDYEFFYPVNDYNKTWRCWPRKPTPEQMRAEKWEE